MLILKGRFSVESQDPGEEHCGAEGETRRRANYVTVTTMPSTGERFRIETTWQYSPSKEGLPLGA